MIMTNEFGNMMRVFLYMKWPWLHSKSTNYIFYRCKDQKIIICLPICKLGAGIKLMPKTMHGWVWVDNLAIFRWFSMVYVLHNNGQDETCGGSFSVSVSISIHFITQTFPSEFLIDFCCWIFHNYCPFCSSVRWSFESNEFYKTENVTFNSEASFLWLWLN